MQDPAAKPGASNANPTFVSQFLKNPKEIGAILPSSPLLGKAMAEFVPAVGDGIVVELGPGTGPITKALLAVGLHEENLVCLEKSRAMTERLEIRFPHLNVIQGDASELSRLLGDKSGGVAAIVSSLPLMSIPDSVVKKIIGQMELCLSPDGLVIQFTYDLRKSRSPLLKAFHRVGSKMVMVNVPPARVDVFKKRCN